MTGEVVRGIDGFLVELFRGLGEQATITHEACGKDLSICNPDRSRLAWFKLAHRCGPGPGWYGR